MTTPKVKHTPIHTESTSPHVSCDMDRPVLLEARGLRKAFGGNVVLDGVDLELRRGEVVLLRGDNGSGKTTLLNILTGNLEPDSGALRYMADDTPREYTFPRKWWQELNPFDHFTPEFVAQEGICRMWQDVRLFNSQTLRDNIAVAASSNIGESPIMAIFAPGRARKSEAQIIDEADTLLKRLGLAGREMSSADKISLGQSKRVAIARAVAAGARILFLDEPLSGLDCDGIAGTIELLNHLVDNHRVTLVLVEHMLNFPHVQKFATTSWLLTNGTLVPSKSSGHDNMLSVSDSTLKLNSIWRSALYGYEVVNEIVSRGATLTRFRPPNFDSTAAKVVLNIRDLIVARGMRAIIGDDTRERGGLNLQIFEGEYCLLQAPNGWGKSTLFDVIVGVISQDKGDILLLDHRLNCLPPWDRVRAGVSAVSSNSSLFPGLRVSEILALAGRARCDVGVSSVSHREFSSLSGGERQRVALASTVTCGDDASLLILDEPFAALDNIALQWAVSAITNATAMAKFILLPSAHHEL